MKTVYLNHAATTAVDKKVVRAMQPYFNLRFGNPSEAHSLGRQAKTAVEEARQQVVRLLGAKTEEIVFTGSATESVNLSHKGLFESLLTGFKEGKKPHLITSSVEHKAVLETCRHLEELGWAEVTYLPVDKYGQVKVKDVEGSVRPQTVLVSVMYVNNEVGTIQPIPEIGRLLKKLNKLRTINNKPRIFFHTDATQAVQHLDCRVGSLGVDLLSFTGHKIYAPKGIGALFVRLGTPVKRQQDGGDQEGKLRAGTENVPYIVALGEASKLIDLSADRRIEKLRDKLVKGILKIDRVALTGHPDKRVSNLASFVVEGVEGEAMELLLSEQKIIVSTGSACTSQSLQPSHVLAAMGIPPESSHGSLRLSLGKDTTEEEVDRCLKVLPKVVQKLREIAPEM